MEHTIGGVGRSILADAIAPFYGFQVPILKDWAGRKDDMNGVMAKVSKLFATDPDGQVTSALPPPLPELGSRGGLTLEIQDRSGTGGLKLKKGADAFIEELKKLPSVRFAEATTDYGVPQIKLAIDRPKAEQLGVPLENLFEALGTYVGSSFVNLFNRFGFVYQVYVQSEASGRQTLNDLKALTVLNSSGEPVRIGSLVSTAFTAGPTAVLSYNTYPAIEVSVGAGRRFELGKCDTRRRKARGQQT